MTEHTDNPNQDLLPGAVHVGKFTIRPMTLKVAIALEKIDSPFVRPVEIDPETNAPIIAKASMEQVAQAMYVFVNSEDPMLIDQLSDRPAFDRCVMNLADQLTFQDIQAFTAAINDMMRRANTAAESAGMRPDVKKEPTGP